MKAHAAMPELRPSICFVAPNAYPVLARAEDIQWIGGAEVQQVIVARGLVKRGFAISMICLDFGQEEVVDIDGVRVFRAFRREAGLPVVRFVWPRLTQLWKCMQKAEADIYYQRGAAMLTGVVSAFARRHGKKAVFAVAGEPKIRFARDRWLYEYGVRRVDRVFVQHAEQAKSMREKHGRESCLIPNCYPAVAHESAPGGDRILWVSTIRRLKRPELLLEMAAAMPQHRFTIVGGPASGDEQFFDLIRGRAEALRNVDFAGFVPYSRVDSYFDHAALFVNTSETEGFPNTFLQAWSRGIPTVSFVDCGARLNGRPVGRVVESPQQMSNVVQQLMGTPALRFEEGRKCRAYFERNHAPDRVLDLYESRFCELVEGNQAENSERASPCLDD